MTSKIGSARSFGSINALSDLGRAIKIITLGLFICLCHPLLAQESKRPSFVVSGKVVDSIDNRGINASTVSVYDRRGNQMIKFGVSQMNGNFKIPEIPLTDSVFLLQVAHIAYKTYTTEFTQKDGNTGIDLGTISLAQKNTLLDEVAVGAPPVLLRNDTLEINPGAFKTAPNAVVEDLLTKVPGIVVWGDGTITVNGKKVTKVLVEGKPFFGGDPTIATRNLPKDGIDKIKVYEEKDHPVDREPPLAMDIILKPESKSGLFGKVGGGLGSEQRHEAIASLNRFTPKTQVSIFGGANNTNKESFSVSDFLRVNTYKAGVDQLDTYGTNFNKVGDNEFSLVGGRVQQQWTDSVSSDVDALLYGVNADIQRQIRERISVDERARQIHTEESERRSENRFRMDQYTAIGKEKHDLDIRASLENRSTDRSVNNNIHSYEDDILLSRLSNNNLEKSTENNRFLSFGYKLKDELDVTDKIALDYSYSSADRDGSLLQEISSTNTLISSPSLSRTINRTYSKNHHTLNSSFDILSLVGKVSNWQLRLLNSISFGRYHESQLDYLKNEQTEVYNILNGSYSYSDQLSESNWKPGISLYKQYTRYLGRGTNRFNFELKVEEDILWRKNHSDNDQRFLDNRFRSLMPSLQLNFFVNRSGYQRRISVNYKKLARRPQLSEQVNLRDTIYTLYNFIGNRSLLPENQHEFSLQLSNISQPGGFVQKINLRYLSRQNQIADSTTYGVNGERTVYAVNVTGSPKVSLDYHAIGSQLLVNKPLTIFLLARMDAEKNNYFVNDESRTSKNAGSSLTTNLSYVPSSFISVQFVGGYSLYYSDDGFYDFNVQSYSYGGSLQLSLPKRITLANSFTSLHNKLSSQPLVRQNLWNVHAFHRFAKKEQFEVKFSMYDLLRQRKNVTYSVFNNSERSQLNNNLQQFFVISFSYFPRVF